jgi:hypothetical protein
VLRRYAEHDLKGIATEDESWFRYSSDSDSIFTDSRESVMPRIRRDISASKIMIPIFFPSGRFLVLETLPKGAKFNQDDSLSAYFHDCIEKRRESHAKRTSQLFQSTWPIRCVVMVAKFRRNLPREALNEPRAHLMLQT